MSSLALGHSRSLGVWKAGGEEPRGACIYVKYALRSAKLCYGLPRRKGSLLGIVCVTSTYRPDCLGPCLPMP